MRYHLTYTKNAYADLLRLGTETSLRIAKKLEYFRSTPDPLRYAKPLSGSWHGWYRFRIGTYRALFSVTDRNTLVILEVFRIRHRKDVYE